MRITDLEAYVVQGAHERLSWVFVRVMTDEGVVGFGDATNWPHGIIIAQALRSIKHCVIGESPFNIERIWERMYGALVPMGFGGVQISCISGVESACWDIIGKVTGQPVYNLIGGKYWERLRLFAIAGDQTKDTGVSDMERRLAGAQWAVDQGFDCIKWSPKGRTLTRAYIREVRELGLKLREVMGADGDISVDLGGVSDVGTDIRYAQAAAECDPLYMEFHAPKNIDALVKINHAVDAPLCIGEHQWARYGFREALEKGAVEVINLDTVRTGGISEARKIAAMAEAYYVRVAPHNPNSPLSTLVSAHAAAGMPNFLILEYMANDAPWAKDILEPALIVEDGHLILPEGPGLGAELNMDVVEAHRIG